MDEETEALLQRLYSTVLKPRGWRETERDFQRLRDPRQEVTLPKLRFMELKLCTE